MHKKFPLGLLIFFGVLGIISIFIPHPSWEAFDGMLRNKVMLIIGAFALILALGNLLRVHFLKVQKHGKNWPFSIVTLSSFFITAIIGLFGDSGAHTMDGSFRTVIGSFEFDIMTIYFKILVPLGATMFAMLAFYMASAAYRSFRAKSTLAALLLVSAFIVMLGQVPIGAAISKHIPAISDIIMRIPNTASKRGIEIGVVLGMLATMLKIMTGIERSWMGGGE